MIEYDKKERAVFAFQMHFKYLLSLTKQVVPWKGIIYQSLSVVDIRTMDEFIRSLDANKDALKAPNAFAAALPTTAPGPASTSSLPVRGVDAGLPEKPALPRNQKDIPATLCLESLDELGSMKVNERFEPAQVHLLERAIHTIQYDYSAASPLFVSDFDHAKNITCEYCGNCARNKQCRFQIAISATIPLLIAMADVVR